MTLPLPRALGAFAAGLILVATATGCTQAASDPAPDANTGMIGSTPGTLGLGGANSNNGGTAGTGNEATGHNAF